MSADSSGEEPFDADGLGRWRDCPDCGADWRPVRGIVLECPVCYYNRQESEAAQPPAEPEVSILPFSRLSAGAPPDATHGPRRR